jgi:hypothetical protein
MRNSVKVAVVLAAMALVLGASTQRVAWGEEDTVMGQYEGTFTPAKGSPIKAEAKVVAEGKRYYRAVFSATPQSGKQAVQFQLRGRLPGKFLSLFKNSKKLLLAGKVNEVNWAGTLFQGKLAVAAKGEAGGKFELTRIEPKSPTEGLKPPAGAIVLFPYEPGKPISLAEWRNNSWKILPDGSVEVGRGDNHSVRSFGDVQVHVEFWLPYEPLGRGQGRGNSGVYFQNFYEIQVLDSFGLPPKNNECAGVYSIAAPKVNACFPPLRWQTYDMTFHAARFSPEGKVVKPATVTIIHNGVKVHEDQPIPRCTERSKPGGEPKVGPFRLQNHGHPVRFRNMWVVELKS